MYLEIDEGFPEHRKTLRFCSLMKDTEAWSRLIRLWKWACRSCKSGDLSGMDPKEIEIAMGWFPMDGKCYAAAAEAGFIDESSPGQPSMIHGWMDFTGAAIVRMESEAQRKRDYRAGKPWEVLRLEILERDQRACRDCGARPPNDTDLHIHHIIPLRKFENKRAANNPSNLITLCIGCHNRRDNEVRRAEAAASLTASDRADPGRNAPSSDRRPSAVPRDGAAPDDVTARTDQSRPVQTSPDKTGDPDARARVAEAEPEAGKARCTGYDLVRWYGLERAQIVTGAVEFHTPRVAGGKAGTFAGGLDAAAIADVRPTMREHFLELVAGKGCSKPDEALADPTYGYACWESAFTRLREKIHKVAAPKASMYKVLG